MTMKREHLKTSVVSSKKVEGEWQDFTVTIPLCRAFTWGNFDKAASIDWIYASEEAFVNCKLCMARRDKEIASNIRFYDENPDEWEKLTPEQKNRLHVVK